MTSLHNPLITKKEDINLQKTHGFAKKKKKKKIEFDTQILLSITAFF